MVRASVCVRRSRWRLTLAALVWLSVITTHPAPAQESPGKAPDAGQLLDHLAHGHEQAPAPSPDRPDPSIKPPSSDSDQMSRLGLTPSDPGHLPRLNDAGGNAPPPDGDPTGLGATIFATVAFVLVFFLLSRALR
ncbi:MAG: hypothetical protein QOJ54_1807 [Aliidongia sp.]|jgi:hypothetical protein|nr:hypothetical protein [Aliidongia sp.]